MDGESITIPTTGGGYDYTVDWGDGTVETNAIIHTYELAGTYTVSISGDFPRIYFNESGDKDKIINIDQWGDIQWTNMRRAFAGCTKINMTATDVPDLSQVNDMAEMFANATVFNGDVSAWDVSHVTNIYRLFFYASSFNQDLSNWDVSNVTVMDDMFSHTRSFNSDISDWDVSNVRTVAYMLYNASAFNQNIGSWSLNAVVNMTGLLRGAAITCENYSGTLIGWAAGNPTVENRSLGANGLQYGTNAETARQQLIDRGWVITGDSPSGVDCSVNATARIANTSGENLPKELITFYPNPAQHQLNIQLAATTVEKIDELVIRSVSGKVLKKKTVLSADLTSLESKITIDISTLNKGIYILEVIGKGTLYQTKFIKK